MGLIEALGYEIPTPNAAQRAMWHVSSSRPGAWLFSRSMHHVDRLVLRLSHGQRTAAGITAGVPVLTVTTTGARTGQPRSTPLLGVPFGSDIAIIGTRFGQPGTPARLGGRRESVARLFRRGRRGLGRSGPRRRRS